MRIKILHVVGDSKFGGASYGILRLARHWKSQSWGVQILSTDTDLQRLAQCEGVEVLPLDVIWRATRPLKDLWGLWKLYRFLRSSAYTLVHTHTTKAGFIGRIAAALAGVPIIIHTAHGFAFHEGSPWWKKLACTLLDRIASIGCKKVIAVSHFHRQWGAALGIAAARKIIAIPNGIPEPARCESSEMARIRAEWGVNPGQVAILTPGRLAPEKGLEDLVDAVALLDADVRSKLIILIAGDGALHDALAGRVARLKLNSCIRLLGFQNDIPSLLCAADMVVLPTWREGLSIALLEAMAQGCAIVTTTIGSNLEVTRNGEGASLVAPGAPKQLAAEITRLAMDKQLRNALGGRARAIYLEEYTLDRMLNEYHNLYKGLFEEFDYAQSVSPLLSSTHR
ncbi:MAG: glycosyltransferase family 4 protein [Acidobacteria bacterium]|nr:glycosyltransferase family 4 protein [Acidobacteriota bacterium]